MKGRGVKGKTLVITSRHCNSDDRCCGIEVDTAVVEICSYSSNAISECIGSLSKVVPCENEFLRRNNELKRIKIVRLDYSHV